jgi:hypothetical protein
VRGQELQDLVGLVEAAEVTFVGHQQHLDSARCSVAACASASEMIE